MKKTSLGAKIKAGPAWFFGNVLAKNLTLAFMFVVSVFVMLIIDKSNTLRVKYLPYLQSKGVIDFLKTFGIERTEIAIAGWITLGILAVLVLAYCIGNILRMYILKAVNKSKDTKKARVILSSVHFVILLLVVGASIIFVNKKGLLGKYAEQNAFSAILKAIGMSLVIIAVILIVVFVVYAIAVSIIHLICMIACKKDDKGEEEAVAPVSEKSATEQTTPAAEEPATEEPVKKEEAEKADEDEPKETSEGTMPETRLNRSFEGKMSQTTEQNVEFYGEIKNYLLSYRNVVSRVSWNYDSFNIGRDQKAKISIKGRTLMLLLALDPAKYADTKYFAKDVSNVKKFQTVPMMVKIKSNRGVKYAKELIDILLADQTKKVRFTPVDYKFESKDDNALIEAGLAKYVNSKF